MDEITTWIWDRVDADRKLSDDAKYLILQALEGGELGPQAPPPQRPATSSANAPEPVGAFIKSIIVQGFRGIGDIARLDVAPRPGLTIVSGRNGSGKSSFAEALEVTLTQSTYRWRNKRNKQYKEAWRNLHTTADPRVEVVLAEESVGQTRIVAQWQDEAVESLQLSLQRPGSPQEPGITSLGWSAALETYRPMLSYDELGAILTIEPSKQYDAISTALGLEQVGEAIARIAAYSASLTGVSSQLKRDKAALLNDLGRIDDDRADHARTLLGQRELDTKALRDMATGVTSIDTDVTRLRALASLSPGGGHQGPAQKLRDAVSAMARAGDDAAQSLERLTSFRQAALALHSHEGDMSCPVCGSGFLDAAWAETTTAAVANDTERLQHIREARRLLVAARGQAQARLSAPPAILLREPPDEVTEHVLAARAAWQAWADAPAEDLLLADHLENAWPPLVTAVNALVSAAVQAVAAREDAWAPLAARVAAFADAADEWKRLKPTDDAVKAGAKWLKANDLELKNLRLRPIKDEAARIWEELRQESNVELADLRLVGTTTQRRLSIEAAVDGREVGALSVMSQGELHALALALFLPRATLPASPFRFVVLDDPVQAMDPAKVDGLVAVLSRIARQRQVIVFSHDDRLAAAVRRSPVNAQILEVQRGSQSHVSIVNTFDPPSRYLRDAKALLKDDGLPEDTLRQVLPGMLRLAIEAACRDRYFSCELAKGTPRDEVEQAWAHARTTSNRLALSIPTAREQWLRPEHRHKALGIASSGMHHALRGDPVQACDFVRRTVDDIRTGAA